MSYWERTKIFMGLTDWVMVGACLIGAVFCFTQIAITPPATLGVFVLPLVALAIWWCNVSPYDPKIGQGPED